MIESRFTQLIPVFQMNALKVFILGCGASGSYIAPVLAKMGVLSFVFMDGDRVEIENVGVQNYGVHELGMYKVHALGNRVLEIQPGAKVRMLNKRYNPSRDGAMVRTCHVMIACVDNLKARRMLWRTVVGMHKCKRSKVPRLYIDPRMGPERWEMWSTGLGPSVHQFNRISYEQSLKGNVPPAPCGAQATPYTAPSLAAMVGNVVKRWVTTMPFPQYINHDIDNCTLYKG